MDKPFDSHANGANKKRKRANVHPDVPGLHIPGRDAPERASRNDIQMRADWILLDPNAISQALHFFDSDKFVQDAVNLKLNHILGAGVSFTRRQSKLNDEAKEWHSATYQALLRQVYRYGLACGFAVWTAVPHEKYIGEPIILDLQKVDIYMLSDLWSRVHFKFFQRRQPHDFSQSNEIDLEIENTSVITFHSPTPNGRIRSIADVLKADWEFEKELQNYSGMACKLKCLPPLVTQEQRSQQAPPIGLAYSSIGVGGPNEHDSHNQTASMSETAYNARVRDAMRLINSGGLQTGAGEAAAIYRNNNGVHQLMSANQVFIDSERVVTRTDRPEEPNRYIEFSQKRRDDVFAFFSIPPGVVAAGGASAGRASTSGSSQNSMTIFINDQKQLKNKFLSIVREIFNSITYTSTVLDLIVSQTRDPRMRRSRDEIRQLAETEIEMSGIPEDNVVMTLYMMGAMTYETFCQIMSGKHGLARSSFYAKPAISVPLLNGIKPEPPQTPSSRITPGR